MRTIFLGSPPFAVPVLRALLNSERHEVVALVTPPDRPRGRGRSIQSSPLVEMAQRCGIEVLQPTTTKGPEFVEELRRFEADVLTVASYGELLRTDVLELAPFGALNVHGSLLPRWRGASPVQAAILAGDEETGISIQRMVLALDAGDILHERRTPIGPDETGGELAARLADLGGTALIEALDLLAAGNPTFAPQDESQVTTCWKIKKDAGRMDFLQSADSLARLARAMNPWPCAFTYLPDGRRLTVLESRAMNRHSAATDAAPGTTLEGKTLQVTTGEGILELVTVKPEGKGAMAGDAFLRGSRLAPGSQLCATPPA